MIDQVRPGGIGGATALAFAGEGARLVLADRSADRLAEVAGRSGTLGGSVGATHRRDPLTSEDVARAVVTAVRRGERRVVLPRNANTPAGRGVVTPDR